MTIRRVLAGLLALALLTSALLTAFAWRVVYRPHLDQMPEPPVDALLVLGPVQSWRMEQAEDLMAQGQAKNLVISTPNMPQDAAYCQKQHPWPVFCFPPDPSTTRGEAIGLKRLAKEQGWNSFAALTVDFHAARSRFILKRCLGQRVPVVGQHIWQWDEQRRYQMAYQLGGFAKEIWLGRCPD